MARVFLQMKLAQGQAKLPSKILPKLSWLGKFRNCFQNPILQATIILTLELLVFFSTPLLHSANNYYSAADITQSYTLVNVTPGHIPANGLFGDPVVSFQPWLMYNREMLWSGKIPLWNPYNAGGAPHLGNYISTVFSLYS